MLIEIKAVRANATPAAEYNEEKWFIYCCSNKLKTKECIRKTDCHPLIKHRQSGGSIANRATERNKPFGAQKVRSDSETVGFSLMSPISIVQIHSQAISSG